MYYRMTKASWDPTKREEIFAVMDSMRDRIKALGVVSVNEIEIGEGQSITVGVYNSKEDADKASAEVSKMVTEDFAQYFTLPPKFLKVKAFGLCDFTETPSPIALDTFPPFKT